MSLFTERLIQARNRDNLVLIIGNGGSLVNALHFELHLQERGLRAISITNPAILSARANDYGTDLMFSTSVSALGRTDDILIAISGSGQSPNILKAARTALTRGLFVVGISFNGGCDLLKYSSLPILIPTTDMGEFEDLVSTLSHTLKQQL